MSKTINQLFREIIALNELGAESPYIFSDPDGVRSGKSGWSFGVCQYDTRNNTQALKCLAECGFSQDEIHGVVDQTIDIRPLAKKLKDNAAVVERYDLAQLQYCLNQAGQFAEKYCVPLDGTSSYLAIADYMNQYGSMGEGAAAFFRSLARPVTAEDVLIFKLEHTKYGKEHPKDCNRRYNNLIKIVKESA